MNNKKIISAGLVIWITSVLYGWITCGWLFNWVYKLPPNIWRTVEEMTSGNSLLCTNLIGLAVALIFIKVYAYLHKILPGQGAKKGMRYGFIVWLVGALSGIAAMPFYMTVANTVVIYWIVSALALNLINGAIAGVMYKD